MKLHGYSISSTMTLTLLYACATLQGLPLATAGNSEQANSTTYYVRGKDTNSSLCPADVEIGHCQTLDFYAENGRFTSHRSFVFLSGTHQLSQEVILRGITGLSMVGVQGSTNCSIICTTASAGFAFFDVTFLHISDLNIHNCGIHKQDFQLAAALIIKDSTNASLNRLVVTNTTGGYGLITINTHDLLSITNSIFAYNKNDSHWEGGNTRIIFSVCEDFEPKFVVIKNTTFHHGYQYYRVFREVGCGGLTIEFNCYNVKVSVEDSEASYNTAYFGGNIDVVFGLLTNNSLRLHNVTSTHGMGGRGTGLFITIKQNVGIDDEYSCDTHMCSAMENVLLNFSNLHFNRNQKSAFIIEDNSYPGTVCVNQYAVIKDSVFLENSSPAWWGGSAVRLAYSPLSPAVKDFAILYTTFTNCTFSGHFKNSHRMDLIASVMYFELVKNVTIENCSIGNNNMSGIQAYSSNVHFKGSTNIFRNTNYYGGGLLLLQNSFMFMSLGTTINFCDNHAVTVGGALFSDFDLQIPTKSPCFYQLDISGPSANNNLISTIKVNFQNNTSGLAGSAIFGGRINSCYSYRHSYVSKLFEKVFKINNTVNDPSAITSDPYYVCFCIDESRLPNCAVGSHNVSVFPGDNFQVSAATVGSSREGTIPGVVHSQFIKSYQNTSFGYLQAAQNSVGRYCSTLNFTIYSLDPSVSFYLSTDKLSFFSLFVFDSKIVTVTFLDCPPGFEVHFSSGRPKCDCEKQLQIHDDSIQCLITSQVIVPPPGSWVGYYNTSTPDTVVRGALFHRYCPYNYCHSNQSYISLNNTDMQCSSNRSGIMCGECQKGLSLTLGRNKCVKCSSISLLFIIVFALAGVALVVLLFVLRLTVTEGSINGLIFYMNVLKMNQALLLPGNETNFLSVFTAWMNLDLGIDLCFYDGMDSIAKTFLQFVFPAYIWLLVILVIVLAKRFRFISNLVGQRAVQVLATLLLLSYTKLQRVIVTSLTYTTLLYPEGSIHYAWLYDGNINYLEGRHIALFVAAIVCFILLILPYTILLTFFKFFQACSDKKLMPWMNNLKPVIDAYAGPYKDNLRFWTGFLLFSRTVLIVTLTLNWTASPDYNLFAAALEAIILIMIVGSLGGIYKYSLYNFLETFCYFNVAAVALILLYNKEHQYAILNGSMGVSFFIFLVVIFIHLFKYTPIRLCVSCIRRRFTEDEANRGNDEDLLFDDRYEAVVESDEDELKDTVG